MGKVSVHIDIKAGRNFLLCLSLLSALPAMAWSSKGHQIVAYIAKTHLTTATYTEVNTILEGNSLVYYASWLDRVVDDPEYSYTSTWHYLNVDEGETYEERSSLAYTDAIAAIYENRETLTNPASSAEERAFALKVLTHVVGDIHQPMHAGHESDKGGNYITVYFNGTRKNLHSVWDYDMVNSAHHWDYYTWQQNIDTLPEEENEAIAAGSIDDWGRECVAMAADVYRAFPKYYDITDEDVVAWTPIVERQLLRGGLRLAKLLNEALDPDFTEIRLPREDIPAIYYNLQGERIANPAIGQIYIVRRGMRTTKEIAH